MQTPVAGVGYARQGGLIAGQLAQPAADGCWGIVAFVLNPEMAD